MDLAKLQEWAFVMKACGIQRVKFGDIEIEREYGGYAEERIHAPEPLEVPPEEEQPDNTDVSNEDLYAQAFGGKQPTFK